MWVSYHQADTEKGTCVEKDYGEDGNSICSQIAYETKELAEATGDASVGESEQMAVSQKIGMKEDV